MLDPKNIKEDLKRCRLSGADIRLACERQSCCSKNCMQKLIQGSLGSSTTSSKISSVGGSVSFPRPATQDALARNVHLV